MNKPDSTTQSSTETTANETTGGPAPTMPLPPRPPYATAADEWTTGERNFDVATDVFHLVSDGHRWVEMFIGGVQRLDGSVTVSVNLSAGMVDLTAEQARDVAAQLLHAADRLDAITAVHA